MYKRQTRRKQGTKTLRFRGKNLKFPRTRKGYYLKKMYSKTRRGRFVPDKYFKKHNIKTGTKVEYEHTSSPYIAKAIAKDHLAEDKRYYKYLKKMERYLESTKPKRKYQRR